MYFFSELYECSSEICASLVGSFISVWIPLLWLLNVSLLLSDSLISSIFFFLIVSSTKFSFSFRLNLCMSSSMSKKSWYDNSSLGSVLTFWISEIDKSLLDGEWFCLCCRSSVSILLSGIAGLLKFLGYLNNQTFTKNFELLFHLKICFRCLSQGTQGYLWTGDNWWGLISWLEVPINCWFQSCCIKFYPCPIINFLSPNKFIQIFIYPQLISIPHLIPAW